MVEVEVKCVYNGRRRRRIILLLVKAAAILSGSIMLESREMQR